MSDIHPSELQTLLNSQRNGKLASWLLLGAMPFLVWAMLGTRDYWTKFAIAAGGVAATATATTASKIAKDAELRLQDWNDISAQAYQNRLYKAMNDSAAVVGQLAAPLPSDPMARLIFEVLQEFKIKAYFEGAQMAPAFVRLRLRRGEGARVSAIEGLSKEFQTALGLGKEPIISSVGGCIAIDLPRPDRQDAWFDQYIQPQYNAPDAPGKLAIGVSIDGRLIEADLSDPSTCHFLIGGTTGSGKSELLRAIILSLVVRYTPDALKLVIVDPKRVTFPEFEDHPCLLQPIIKNEGAAIRAMADLVVEMEKRYELFEAAGVADLQAYNRKAAKPLPRLVMLFDEYADYMAIKPIKEAIERSVKRLGGKARASGIHLILATQRPDKDVVTPLIRSNLPGRICLMVATEGDSQIVLGGNDNSGKELLGKGDLIYLVAGNKERLQGLRVGDDARRFMPSHSTAIDVPSRPANPTALMDNGGGNVPPPAPTTTQQPYTPLNAGLSAAEWLRRCWDAPGGDREAAGQGEYIYLLWGEGTNYYKIGFTNDPERRYYEISPKMPFESRVAALIPATPAHPIEQALHAAFAELRTNGEWFLLSPTHVAWFQSAQRLFLEDGLVKDESGLTIWEGLEEVEAALGTTTTTTTTTSTTNAPNAPQEGAEVNRATYDYIRSRRREGALKTTIVCEKWGCANQGGAFNKATREYDQIVCEFGFDWFEELIGQGIRSKRRIISEMWNTQKRSAEDYRARGELLDTWADQLGVELIDSPD